MQSRKYPGGKGASPTTDLGDSGQAYFVCASKLLPQLFYFRALLALRGLLVAAARLSSCSTWLSCPRSYRIFPDQALNQCPLRWQGRCLTTGPPGKSHFVLFYRLALFTKSMHFFCEFFFFSFKENRLKVSPVSCFNAKSKHPCCFPEQT